MNNQENHFPYVEIIEQPASKAIRFRYECEGRSAGSIPGANSEFTNKTYPSIRIVGYEGRAVIVISCVTKDRPFMPHPHSIVGRETCNRGVCTMEVYTQPEKPIIFQNLGIQCVKKNYIERALRQRAEIRVDPFKTGYDFKRTNVDLTVVRLCFQVFLEGSNGKFQVPLQPVVSTPVYDKKSTSDLQIYKLSHASAPICGGMEMIILCEKVVRDNVQVVFYESQNDQVVWRDFGQFSPGDVHKQTAIVFRTPRYPINQHKPIQVYIQLRKPSDGSTSEPVPFTMMPPDTVDDPINSLKRKRQKMNTSGQIDLPLIHRPDCKCTCLDTGACAVVPPPNVTITKQSYGLNLLQQLQEEEACRIELRALEEKLNIQKNVKNNNNNINIDGPVPTSLKNVTPSIFPPRFTPNSSGKWNNNLYNGPSQIPVTNYQNKMTQQPMVESNPPYIPSTSLRPLQQPQQPQQQQLPQQQQQQQQQQHQQEQQLYGLSPVQQNVHNADHNHNESNEPMLYKIQQKDPLGFDSIKMPIDLDSCPFNFDVNPLEVLTELNSADLAGLSETFSASFSIADPAEFDPIKNL